MAQDALDQLELDHLVFVPAAVSPYKRAGAAVPGAVRLEMLRRAVAGDLRFSVSDLELARGGVSYTIDTVSALQEAHPDADWVLLIGADNLEGLDRWHRAGDLLGLCEIAIFPRTGSENLEEIVQGLDFPSEQKQHLLDRVLKIRRIEISSSEIRARIRSARSVRYLLPPEVEEMIAAQGFYRE